MKFLQIFLAIIVSGLVFVSIIAMGWILMGNDLAMQKYFSPKKEEVKREVFEQSKQYQHGTIQELYKIQTEYLKSNDDAFKKAMAQRALFMCAEFDRKNLPDDLRQWIYSIETTN